MSDPSAAEVFEQLRRVIAEEMAAQLGIHRAPEAMPPLIADTVLACFDVALKPGVELRFPD
ncbi:hypothetical protein [Cellulomonas sp. NPDC058312]|uniref:hypothetical protein n=1 Tax=Cellulomonas sp. NPDC058312 TaxID=3346441 RepID=UPI0036EAA231